MIPRLKIAKKQELTGDQAEANMYIDLRTRPTKAIFTSTSTVLFSSIF